METFKKYTLAALAAGALAFPLASPASATASAEITQMSDDITALTNIAKTVVLPVASVVIAFAGGALIIKRVIYS